MLAHSASFVLVRSTGFPFGRAAASGLLLVAVLAAAGCGDAGAAHDARGGGSQPPMRATVVKPERKPLVRTIELPGQVEAYETAPLFAKATGYVSTIAVDIGDVVKGPHGDEAGQILCELHVPELEDDLAEKTAAIAFAKAQLAQAQATVKVAESAVLSARSRIAEAKSSAAGEEARYVRWKSEYDRVSELAANGAVTKKVADETRAELDAADAGRQEVLARVASAEAAEQEAAAGVEKARADALAAEAHLTVAEAERRRAATLVEYAKVRAPFDGVVVERRVHTGWLVASGGSGGGAPMFTVVRADPARVVLEVPESDAVYVSGGTKVELRIPSLPGEPFVGQVARTSWSLNTSSRTLTVEVDVPNQDRRWRPGLYVRANVVVAELPDALTLPKAAIVSQDKQSWAYCVEPD
ncbi:MAG TPA: efflux RND transporter periplasmic adaptor subunit, partial [Pirellulales bacterium]